jgi:hypothetical protein
MHFALELDEELYRRLDVRLRQPAYLDLVAAPADQPRRVSLDVLEDRIPRTKVDPALISDMTP